MMSTDRSVAAAVAAFGLAIAVGVALSGGPAWSAEAPEDAAQAAAESWLALVDEGKYEESWEGAAELFKGAVTADRWKEALGGARKPLGKVVSRTVKSRQYTEELPGAPDGRYVVLQFETEFENKAAAVETVTPMVDPDGEWRVSGYFIK